MPIDRIVTIASLCVGAVGAGFAVLMYFRPRKRTRLAYQTSHLQYFDQASLSLPNQASMTFEGNRVVRLSKTTVVLWNTGTEVLRGEDIVRDDPIRISIEGGRLLNHRVVKTTADATKVALTDRPAHNELAFGYDYLNSGDGAVVELTHDGTATAVIGSARGLKGGPEDWGEIATNVQPFGNWLLRKSLWGLALLGCFSFAYWYLVVLRVNSGGIPAAEAFSLFLGGVLGIAGLMSWQAIDIYWRRRRRHPAVLAPDKLDLPADANST